MSEHVIDREEIELGHRPSSDTPELGVAAFGAILLGGIAAIFAGIWLLIFMLGGLPSGSEPASEELEPVDRPGLQIDPAVDLLQVRRREDFLLNRYEWVDREAGVVRIPIERAMEVFAAGSESQPDTIRLITESGFADVVVGMPAPSAPAMLGPSPEPAAVNAEIAEILGLIRIHDGPQSDPAEAAEPPPKAAEPQP